LAPKDEQAPQLAQLGQGAQADLPPLG